jgi:hypothetical protein
MVGTSPHGHGRSISRVQADDLAETATKFIHIREKSRRSL